MENHLTPVVGAVFFSAFWVLTAVALAWHRHAAVRRAYLILFFLCLIAPGLLGHSRWLWPFFDWHLWGGLRSYRNTYVELMAGDARGNRLVFDSRAVRPLLPTQTHFLAGHFLGDANPDQKDELARFLIARANRRREELLDPRTPSRFPSYPLREYGRSWTEADARAVGPFDRVYARRVAFVISADGQAVEQTLIEEKTFP